MKRGQQKAYPAHTGFRHQVHLIGGLDWCDETVHALPVVSKNSDSFISFLEWLCGHIYPDDPFVIVFDNVTLTIVAINNNFDFRNRNIDYSSSR